MTVDAPDVKKATPSKVWMAVLAATAIVAVLILPIAALVCLVLVWFAPVWSVTGRRLLVARIATSAGCLLIMYPAVTAAYRAYQDQQLTCSSPHVLDVAKRVIADEILKSPSSVVELSGIRTQSGADILTCRAQVTIDPVPAFFSNQVVYTAEMTDAGDEFYVRVQFE